MQVLDNPDSSRWEARNADGELAGVAQYQLADGVVTFTHTEVCVQGQGVGGQLARAALQDARSRGLRVAVRCPFIGGWIDKHPEMADLLV